MPMNKLKPFLSQMSPERRQQFCIDCGTTLGYVRKALSTGALFGPALCVAIERESAGSVTRRDLRPNDWQDIWPELARQKETA
ncbi:helix-turn-helix domain-containing protein [Burkholderia multivorans]|nr:YdaS family helix-turn-helix protein [Burkholderia multivorans]MCO1385192.1 helix-turn-helix domain-containing protein [Burkholderia multivorans]UQO79726.1 helix-turn-helix domain-containing protein [Burkholderia multivorans]HDR9439500.1 Cro/Cl family transcriptional regulator [Burkholderia multivorans]